MGILLREQGRRVALIGRVRRVGLVARGYSTLPAARERVVITEAVEDTAALHPVEDVVETVPVTEQIGLQPWDTLSEQALVTEVVRELGGIIDPVREEVLVALETLADNLGAVAFRTERVSVSEVAAVTFEAMELRPESRVIVERVVEGMGADVPEPITISELATDVAMLREIRVESLVASEAGAAAVDFAAARVESLAVTEVATAISALTEPVRQDVLEVLEAITEATGSWVAEKLVVDEVVTAIINRSELRAEAIPVVEAAVDWIAAHNSNDFQTETLTVAEAHAAATAFRSAITEAVAIVEAATDTMVTGDLTSVLPAPQAGLYLVWGPSGTLVNKTAAEMLALLFGTVAPVEGGIWINEG